MWLCLHFKHITADFLSLLSKTNTPSPLKLTHLCLFPAETPALLAEGSPGMRCSCAGSPSSSAGGKRYSCDS